MRSSSELTQMRFTLLYKLAPTEQPLHPMCRPVMQITSKTHMGGTLDS